MVYLHWICWDFSVWEPKQVYIVNVILLNPRKIWLILQVNFSWILQCMLSSLCRVIAAWCALFNALCSIATARVNKLVVVGSSMCRIHEFYSSISEVLLLLGKANFLFYLNFAIAALNCWSSFVCLISMDTHILTFDTIISVFICWAKTWHDYWFGTYLI